MVRDGNGVIGQCRATKITQAQLDDLVLMDIGGTGQLFCCVQFGIVTLTVIEAEGVAVEALFLCQDERGDGVESTGEEYYGFVHGL